MHVYYTRGSTSQLARVECDVDGNEVALVTFHFRAFQKDKKKLQLQAYFSTSAFGGSVAFFWQYNKIALTDVSYFSLVMKMINSLNLLDEEDKPLLSKFITCIVGDDSCKRVLLADPRKFAVMLSESKRLTRANLYSLDIQCEKSKVSRIYWNMSNGESKGVVIFQFAPFTSNVKRQRLIIYLAALKVFDAAVIYDWNKNCLILSDFRHFKLILRLLRTLQLSSPGLAKDLLYIMKLELRASAESDYLNVSAIHKMSKVLLRSYIDEIFDCATSVDDMAHVKHSMLLVMQSVDEFTSDFHKSNLPYKWKDGNRDALMGINLILNGYMGELLAGEKGSRRAVKDELRRHALDYVLVMIREKFFVEKMPKLYSAMSEIVMAMSKLIESAVVNESPMRAASSSRFFAQENNGRSVGMAQALDYNDVGKILHALELIDDDGRHHLRKLKDLQYSARSADINHYMRELASKLLKDAVASTKLQKATSSRSGFRN